MNSLLKFTKRFVLPLWRWYFFGILALAVTNFITLEIPQIAKHIINALSANEISGNLKWYAWTLIGLGVTTIIIRGTSRILLFWPGRKLEASFRNYMFSRIMHLPQAFYDRFGMGELVSRLTNDIGQLRAFYAFGVLQLINLGFLTIFTISKMLSVHVLLTIVCLAPMFLMMISMKNVFTKLHKLSLGGQVAIGKLTNKVTEAFVNVHVIKANSAEETFLKRAEEESFEVYRNNIDSLFVRTVFFPLLNSLMNLSQVLVVFIGGYEVIHGRLTVGDILAFNVYLAYLSFPLSAFGIIVSLYQRCIAALQRISEVETFAPEGESEKKSLATSNKVPRLTIKNLNFAFPNAKTMHHFELSEINIDLRPGMRLGIFGPIGSGKTTLFNLMTRLIDPPRSTIFLDGVDVLDIDPNELRAKIGYVQQTVHLFSTTISKNISFGLKEQDQSALSEAADQAQVREDIEGFSAAWSTEIGEKGIRLSGGQKQRIALARFLLRKPPILLLDDVLSAVDKKTEKRMVDTLKSLKSSLVIASHRTLALQQCDEVILLDKGRILDRGLFSDLKEKYTSLFEQEYDAHGK